MARYNCTAQKGHELTSILHWSQEAGEGAKMSVVVVVVVVVAVVMVMVVVVVVVMVSVDASVARYNCTAQKGQLTSIRDVRWLLLLLLLLLLLWWWWWWWWWRWCR